MEKKASFLQRLSAYMIDIFLVSFVAALLSYAFLDYESIEKLDNSYMEVSEKALNGEVSLQVFTVESASIVYQMASKQGVTTIMTLFLTVLYFVVYQYYNDGQTMGKKIMKIKVVSNDSRSLTMNNYIYRACVIDSLLVNIFIFILLLFGKDMVYFVGAGTLRLIDYSILFVSAIMVLSSKNGRALQDVLANTKVIRV